MPIACAFALPLSTITHCYHPDSQYNDATVQSMEFKRLLILTTLA